MKKYSKYSYKILEIKLANGENSYIAKITELYEFLWFKWYDYISSPYVDWFSTSHFYSCATKFKTIEDAEKGALKAIEKLIKNDSEKIVNMKEIIDNSKKDIII